MTNYCTKFCFFFCHSIIHIFGYIIPRLVRFLGGLLICKPFRKNMQEAEGYIWHPESEVRVIHHTAQLETCVDVFGLMDVANSVLEDRQYCWPTEDPAERKRLKKEAEAKMLKYTSPLYSGHITTIMGCFRPSDALEYERESMTAWDGCPVMLDWLYADGEAPICRGRNRYSHLTLENELDYAPVVKEDGTLMMPPLPPGDPDDDVEEGLSDSGSSGPSTSDSHVAPRTQHEPLDQEDELSTPSEGRHTEKAQEEATTGVAVDVEVKPARGLIVIFPGLSSYSQTNYIKSFARALHRQGYHVCVLNVRGNGDTPLTTSFIFNGAYTRDTRDAMRFFCSKKALIRRFGRTMPVIGLGLSIGGAMLSKYLGEQGRAGAESHIDAAFTMCAPNDFLHMVEHMNRGTYQKNIYQDDMCADVRNYVLRHRALHKLPNVDNEWVAKNIHRFKRVIHFDEHILAKSCGYRSIHHYHIDTSAITWVPYSPVPLLVLSSFDDPVIGRSAMPHRWKEIVQSNPRVVYVEPHPGGHLGFLGGPIDELVGRDNWMERFVLQRLDTLIQYWESVQHEPERFCSGLMANCQHLQPTKAEYQRRLAAVQRHGKPFTVNFQDVLRHSSNNSDSGSETADSYDVSDLKYNVPPLPNRLSNRCYLSHPTVAVVRSAPQERLLHNFFDTHESLGMSRSGHRGLPREETDRIAEYLVASRMGSPCGASLRPTGELPKLTIPPAAITSLPPPSRYAVPAPIKPDPPLVENGSRDYNSSTTTGGAPSYRANRLPPRTRRAPVDAGCSGSTYVESDAQHTAAGGRTRLPLSSSSTDNSRDPDDSNRVFQESSASAFSDDVHIEHAGGASSWLRTTVAQSPAPHQYTATVPGHSFALLEAGGRVQLDDVTYDAEDDAEDSAEELPLYDNPAHERMVNRFARENTRLFNQEYGVRSGRKPFNDYNMTSMEEERLPRHVPVVTNADYFVDPRAYMNKDL